MTRVRNFARVYHINNYVVPYVVYGYGALGH